jgi:hypothetical protein
MDLSMYGKWAWVIGLVVLVLWFALSAVVDLSSIPEVVGDIAVALAFLGGILYIAGMKNRTDFLIIALALVSFSASAGTLFVDQLGGLVSGALAGAAAAAAAAAAGALLVVTYEWIMSATK